MANLNQFDGKSLQRRLLLLTRRHGLRTLPPAVALLLLAGLGSGAPLAQQPASPPAPHQPAAAASGAHRPAPRSHAHKQAQKPSAGAKTPPPPPPRPNWPAEQPPNPATVTWDSKGLSIQANNSSLEQILHDISTDTGVQLQGLSQDERVFGNYGPGPAREIISQLLDGSGYNMIMIGGSGDQPPRQILLTRSAPGSPQPPAAQPTSNQGQGELEDEPTQTYPEPAQPLPPRSPFGQGGPPRTPQQIQQEMLLRQQQMQQQNQQNQQNAPR